MTKPLVVYKASAGSGKTFTLATEYIKLLIANPNSYRSILAVTFTNKATEEMKMRILSQLYGIWKGYSDSASYTNKVCTQLGMDVNAVRSRAGYALQLLLHHYSYFRVETIDSFFQSVLRNLARELDLTANLRIELNDTQVEEMAVDKLIEGLTFDDEVMKWILDYINDNISEDKNWNVINHIKNFGRTIFKDYYQAESERISEIMSKENFFTDFIEKIKKERDEPDDIMKNIAASFFDAMEANNLAVEDLAYGKTGVASFFIKIDAGNYSPGIIGKRVLEAAGNPEKWSSKKSPRRQEIYSLALNELVNILNYGIEQLPEQWCRHQSAELTLRHLNQLRLLGCIENKVRELNAEAGRFLLSNTQQLLHSLISDSDSPFIFEKIGTMLEHVMIDEFQDTSTVQWQNFKILLKECMSHSGTENLIVGDVKQSIYRWRSGDWRLLNDIKAQFDSHEKMLDIRSLDTNYRSQGNIISFNNEFFKTAAEIEYQSQAEQDEDKALQLKTAYSDVAQKIPVNKGLAGQIEVTLLEHDEYEGNTLNMITERVSSLLDAGVRQNEIAILARTNNQITKIASHFSIAMPSVSIVSDEAFRLDSSLAINIIILALHCLTHPDDVLTQAALVKRYQCNVMGADSDENGIILSSRDKFSAKLPDEYDKNRATLLTMPLYELVERIYDIFELKKISGQSAYMCAFYDKLGDFTSDYPSDIDLFVNEWENSICSSTIHSDELDGIRLVSIHKSKGLEYDNVIIPFCDWQLEKYAGNVLWCRPDRKPFNALPLVPVDYSKNGMMGTIFEKDYVDENLQNTVDNLNLLYVAFTRASNNLFVYGKRKSSNSRSALIEKSLPLIAKKLEGSVLTGDEDDSCTMKFMYGELFVPERKEVKKQSENVFLQPVGTINIELETFRTKVEFKQSNKSRDFIENDGEEKEDKSDYIKMGNILHNVFSRIRTSADIDEELFRMQTEGVLYDDTMSYEKITDMLRKRLSSQQVSDWFSAKWTLFNECTILSIDKETDTLIERRPDRVMYDGNEMIVVDFKFGRPRNEYHEQVREYMSLLNNMGYNNVRGYLWFVYSNSIEEVAL